ncbi:hypothetical protein NHX12_019985 [Muraenolepis orangiensis]|uniref:Retinol dehydrogenase 11 n=1 Tax=Muraenolepis orangiensis TaxID=630683 RepID=A0A9Q0EUQ0_9TELE|nr:hypothetical protein NHX12_019985 [Muraenolepis orangiensis]
MILALAVSCVAVTTLLMYFFAPFIRSYAAGGVCRSTARLDGKTVLITGANTGIGKETARDLARRGARVIIACRNMAKGAKAVEDIQASCPDAQLELRQLDLADTSSVRAFAQKFLQEVNQLHILINNAGVMLCHFLLTSLLIGLLKRSAPARVVVVSSLVHHLGWIRFHDLHSQGSYNSGLAYCQSKLANVMFTRELARRLKGTNVTVNSLHPGTVTTDLTRHSTLVTILFTINSLFFKTPQQGAQTSVYCAVAEELHAVSGKHFSDCSLAFVALQGRSEETARRLWDTSCEHLGIEWD